MATVLSTQIDSVLSDPRAKDRNVPESDRTYFEILTDPEAGDLVKQDVVESFRRPFVKPPPVKGQEMRSIKPSDPRFVVPEAPTGGLLPGETVNPDGSINYSPALEATQSAKFTVNLGSLVGGKMTAEGYFLPGPPRPGSPSFTFNLPPGMRPNEITADTFDKIMKVVRAKAPAEYQAAKEYESVLVSGSKAFTREGILGIPAIADLPGLVFRGLDYVFSPVGTNTLAQDITQLARKTFGLSDTRTRP